MYSRIFAILGLLLICSMHVGCGGPAPDTKFTVANDTIVQGLRTSLEGMKKSGQKSSMLSALETDINGIKTTDKVKGEELLKLYVELDAAKTPEQVKAICTKMLEKL